MLLTKENLLKELDNISKSLKKTLDDPVSIQPDNIDEMCNQFSDVFRSKVAISAINWMKEIVNKEDLASVGVGKSLEQILKMRKDCVTTAHGTGVVSDVTGLLVQYIDEMLLFSTFAIRNLQE